MPPAKRGLLDLASLVWSAPVETARTTAAAMLRAQKAWSLDAPARRFDAEDWWFKARLPDVETSARDELALVFDGLATVADVWLDGELILESNSMFLRHERIMTKGGGELVICCRSLDTALGAKRPRPKWRAPMIENQQIRWFRTTLLGRTPGWSPPAAVVGPWGGVALERRRGIAVDDVRLKTSLDGTSGVVDISVRVRSLGDAVGRVELTVSRSGSETKATLEKKADDRYEARLTIPNVARWWPHTHGEPALYDARLDVGTSSIVLHKIGFREVTQDGDFSIAVNGVPFFARGACWTPLDVVTMRSDRAAYAHALGQARAAGMNTIRVGGTMAYESDDFYDLADELGILLWHDFMFANMDYPEEDAAFAESVALEARQFLGRLGGRPSLGVLCGNSEGEQQAAMFGAGKDRWSPKLFHETLPSIAKESHPDVPYWPSSAHGGTFPHEPRSGTTSYYGVGAYLRPLEDARRSEVRFATECLAFANVPEGETSVRARSPRDLGAGWDFVDVRDHYVKLLFNVDPPTLRYGDQHRYLDLGRAAVAEAITATFGEWRRAGSQCRGGFVWFLRDLWEGAGWGIIGADGTPKSGYWAMRDACAPVAVHLSDEGVNGVHVHVANDRGTALTGELEVTLYRAGEIIVGSKKQAVEVAPHTTLSLATLAMFDGFMDLSYAYRFGPPSCDLIVATMTATNGERFQAFYFPVGRPSTREIDIGLSAEARAVPDVEGAFDIVVKTRRFAQHVVLEAEGFSANAAWFHLPPGGERTVRVQRHAASGALKGTVRALNSESTPKIALPST